MLSIKGIEIDDRCLARFWKHVEKTDGCWIWTARRSRSGYGRFNPGRRSTSRRVQAHRFAWTVLVGPIPDGMRVLHDCPGGDNPACVNPAHLWLGTDADNMADRDTKGRGPQGVRNGRAILTPATVEAIRRRAAHGAVKCDLAAEFGVTSGAIYHVCNGISWRSVGPSA